MSFFRCGPQYFEKTDFLGTGNLPSRLSECPESPRKLPVPALHATIDHYFFIQELRPLTQAIRIALQCFTSRTIFPDSHRSSSLMVLDVESTKPRHR